MRVSLSTSGPVRPQIRMHSDACYGYDLELSEFGLDGFVMRNVLGTLSAFFGMMLRGNDCLG